jgi:hypothetical protein
MTPAIVDLIAPTFYRREGSPKPEERVPRCMEYYGCSEEHAKEMIKIMDMLAWGCTNAMRDAFYARRPEKEAAEHFFEITFPGLSDAAKKEIMRYASWCISKG